MQTDYSQIVRNIAETKRLMRMTTYQRLNERVAYQKADRWIHHCPLSAEQLRDDEHYQDLTTIQVGVFGKFVVITRPTERTALEPYYNPQPFPTRGKRYSDDRWCILCQTRHAPRNFVHSKRYLNGMSYACKSSLRRLRKRTWRFEALKTA